MLTSLQTRFLKELELTDGGGARIHTRDKLRDFFTVSALALRQRVHQMQTHSTDQALEEEYNNTVKHYKAPEHFGNCLAILSAGLADRSHDFLGEVYMSIDAGNSNTGQFFTPQSVSDVCAMIALGLNEEEFNQEYDRDTNNIGRKRCLIHEPAVGAGGMLIAIHSRLRECKADPWQYWMEGIDVDRQCCQMAYIQLTLLGVPAAIYCGNTLGQHAGRENPPWITFVGALYPLRRNQARHVLPERAPVKLSLPLGVIMRKKS